MPLQNSVGIASGNWFGIHGVKCILEGLGINNIVFEAGNIDQLLKNMEKHPFCDVLIIDNDSLCLNQKETWKRLNFLNPTCRIISLGSMGMVTRKEDLQLNLTDVPTLRRQLAKLFDSLHPKSKCIKEQDLSFRELEVLQLLVIGHTNKEIGELLHISQNTVKSHRMHIMQKLDIHSVPALTVYALERGLVQKEQVGH